MENLTPDALFSIALNLELPDLLQLCNSHPNINRKLCNKDKIWYERLQKDFKLSGPQQLIKIPNIPNNPKDLYILLWSLTNLKKELDLDEHIYTLYSLNRLNLNFKDLIKIPSSIRFLTNLQKLELEGNRLKILPELPNSLQVLNVRDNRLKELHILPATLQQLILTGNDLTQLPDNLPDSLKKIYVTDNKIKKFPNRLPSSLKELYIGDNLIEELPDNLPNSLQYIYADRNLVKELPDILPNSLIVLNVNRNPVCMNYDREKYKKLYPKLNIICE